MTNDKLLKLALSARENAYSPYSNFSVGAALLCTDGTVYTGCNIENASYSPTICAERVAFFKAVSEGKREFAAIAIAGGNHPSACPPCGVCRQVMTEFCTSDFAVILSGKDGSAQRYTLQELLPFNFSKDTL